MAEKNVVKIPDGLLKECIEDAKRVRQTLYGMTEDTMDLRNGLTRYIAKTGRMERMKEMLLLSGYKIVNETAEYCDVKFEL